MIADGQPKLHVVLFGNMTADYSIEYANALARKADVTLLAPRAFFGGMTQYVDRSVDLRLLRWPRHRSPGNIIFLGRLGQMIDRTRPDVLHFLSESVTWLAVLAAIASKKYRVVTTMHDVVYHPGDHESQLVPRWFADKLLYHSHKVIVHGAALQADAERLHPRLKGRIEVLPHLLISRYLEIADAHALHRRNDPTLNILFFGRIYSYKGLDTLIRGIELAGQTLTNLRLIIAGRGEDMGRYQRLMNNPDLYEVRNRYISDIEVAQLSIDADIVALPYLEASQSGVLAIASAFGKAVIVTDVGELGQTISDGETGIVIKPGNEQALAGAILRLAADEALRSTLGNALRRAVADTVSAARGLAAAAVKIYESIA